jgi:hypothetical protein
MKIGSLAFRRFIVWVIVPGELTLAVLEVRAPITA